MKLFFDTETTGKANFNARPDAQGQPRVVSLAALLMEDQATEVACLNVVLTPDGFLIPAEAAAIHGITTAQASKCGVPRKFALELFASLASLADEFVAHNIAFDHFLMRGEFSRANMPLGIIDPDRLFCTMLASAPILQLPGRYGAYKWPKLEEAHLHAFGMAQAVTHNALADVRACARIYWWLKDIEKQKSEKKGGA